MEESDSELQEIEVESSFFDPLIKFPMVWVDPLDSVDLGDEASEFAVESHKMGSLYFLKDEIKVLFEVARIDLHKLFKIKL